MERSLTDSDQGSLVAKKGAILIWEGQLDARNHEEMAKCLKVVSQTRDTSNRVSKKNGELRNAYQTLSFNRSDSSKVADY